MSFLTRRNFLTSTALAAVSAWFVPFSLEYTWMFLLMLVQMHLVVSRRFPADWHGRCLFFLASGVAANYLDFLTTGMDTGEYQTNLQNALTDLQYLLNHL